MFLAGTALLLFAGLLARWALYLSIVFAALAAFCACAWILLEREVQAGPAFTIAIAGLVAVAAGATQILMVPVASTRPRELGDFVDGLKHGRWHIYDDRGVCVAIEEWDRGRLVARRPVGTSTA